MSSSTPVNAGGHSRLTKMREGLVKKGGRMWELFQDKRVWKKAAWIHRPHGPFYAKDFRKGVIKTWKRDLEKALRVPEGAQELVKSGKWDPR